MYTYNGQQFTVGDFKTQIKDHTADVEKMDNKKWGQLVDMMGRNFLMRAYTVEFENRPEVKNHLEDIKKNLYSNYFYAEYLKKKFHFTQNGLRIIITSIKISLKKKQQLKEESLSQVMKRMLINL